MRQWRLCRIWVATLLWARVRSVAPKGADASDRVLIQSYWLAQAISNPIVLPFTGPGIMMFWLADGFWKVPDSEWALATNTRANFTVGLPPGTAFTNDEALIFDAIHDILRPGTLQLLKGRTTLGGRLGSRPLERLVCA